MEELVDAIRNYHIENKVSDLEVYAAYLVLMDTFQKAESFLALLTLDKSKGL
jgi:hypothetical protein